MTIPRTGLPRFLAYNLANGRRVMTGMDARQILNHIRDHMWPSVDEQSVEILDCGPNGVDAEAVGLSLEEVRERFATVYRGVAIDGLVSVALVPTR